MGSSLMAKGPLICDPSHTLNACYVRLTIHYSQSYERGPNLSYTQNTVIVSGSSSFYSMFHKKTRAMRSYAYVVIPVLRIHI